MALVAAHSLGKRGIEVIGCDDVEMTVMGFSRYVSKTFVHAPLDKDPDRFLKDLVEKVQRFKPEDDRPYILMPIFRETEIIARNRELFEPYIKVAAPDYATIQAVHPKDNLATTADMLNIHVPKTLRFADLAELNTQAESLAFPLLIKPTDQVGGRGIIRVENPNQLKREFKISMDYYNHPPLIQEIVGGEDYCLTALYEHGVRRMSMAYKNIHRFPAESGAGSFRETVTDSPFVEIADSLLGPLKWHGIVELDLRWDGINTPHLIEINPRFWAGLFQSVTSGTDFPYMLYHMTAFDEVPEVQTASIGQRTKIPGLWLIGAVGSIAQSEKDYTRLRSTWQEVQAKIRSKEIREGFQVLQEMTEKKTGLKKTIAALRKLVRDGREAKNDIFFRDDPFIVLGILFILASLIRHRKLPPEFRYR
ncbi:hypothetical protein JCM12856_24870 [Spirochaeta dissipatitropha]